MYFLKILVVLVVLRERVDLDLPSLPLLQSEFHPILLVPVYLSVRGEFIILLTFHTPFHLLF